MILLVGLAGGNIESNRKTCSNLSICVSFSLQEFKLPDMDGFPSIIAEIVRDCLHLDPSLRPTADDIAERLVKSQFRSNEVSRDEDGNTELHRWVVDDDKFKIDHALRNNQPIMMNAVNARGETPLMLVKSEEAQEALLSYRKVPSYSSEPSRIPEFFHNIDEFGTFLRLTQREDLEGIRSLGRVEFRDFEKQVHDQRAAWRGETPLHIAARSGNTELFDMLMNLKFFDERKVNIDAQTALHLASVHGHAGIIEQLVRLQDDSKADSTRGAPAGHFVNIQDNLGKTALHVPAQGGKLSATDMLLRYKSTKVNMTDVNGQSPLFASLSGASANQQTQVAVLKRFLEHPRVDINKTDSSGETIFHKVAREGNAITANVLIGRKRMRT